MAGSAVRFPPELAGSISRGGGRPIPEAVRGKMERCFAADFSAVRVHTGGEATAIGALAFTQGSNIHFAPGQYDPLSARGQRLLAHELTHVIQQRAGRVRNPFGSGVAVVLDTALEAEAERMGLRAASMPDPVKATPASFPARLPIPGSQAVQRAAALVRTGGSGGGGGGGGGGGDEDKHAARPSASGGAGGQRRGGRKGPNPRKQAWKAQQATSEAQHAREVSAARREDLKENEARLGALSRVENRAIRERARVRRGGGAIAHTNRASDYAPVQHSTLAAAVTGVIAGGHDTGAEAHTTDPVTGVAAADGVSVREYAPNGKASPIRLVSRNENTVVTWYYSDAHTIHGNYQYRPVNGIA